MFILLQLLLLLLLPLLHALGCESQQFETTATKEQVKSLRANPRAMRRLQTACENTKRALSSAPSAQVYTTKRTLLLHYTLCSIHLAESTFNGRSLLVLQHTLYDVYSLSSGRY
jgi:molecular chaperone DnaK (HSP70)